MLDPMVDVDNEDLEESLIYLLIFSGPCDTSIPNSFWIEIDYK